MKIAVLAGDGIGPEVTREAVRVLEALGLPGLELVPADVGGAAPGARTARRPRRRARAL